MPGFPGGRCKPTLVGRTVAPKVSFLAPPRTHTLGQVLSLVAGGYLARYLKLAALWIVDGVYRRTYSDR